MTFILSISRYEIYNIRSITFLTHFLWSDFSSFISLRAVSVDFRFRLSSLHSRLIAKGWVDADNGYNYRSVRRATNTCCRSARAGLDVNSRNYGLRFSCSRRFTL
jgi:hypothetical protein